MSILLNKQYALSELDSVAASLLAIGSGFEVWALSGELGAGKTTLTAALLRNLGSEDHVSSPTFSIINHYKIGKEDLYHSDWYRLVDEEDAIQAGVEDMLEMPGMKIIEWWERAAELLPKKTLFISISVLDSLNRQLIVSTKANQ